MAVSLSIWVKRGFFMPDVGGQPLSTEYIFSCVSAELPVVLEVSNYREAEDNVEMCLGNGHIPGLGLPRLRSQAAVAGNEMYCTILHLGRHHLHPWTTYNQ